MVIGCCLFVRGPGFCEGVIIDDANLRELCSCELTYARASSSELLPLHLPQHPRNTLSKAGPYEQRSAMLTHDQTNIPHPPHHGDPYPPDPK